MERLQQLIAALGPTVVGHWLSSGPATGASRVVLLDPQRVEEIRAGDIVLAVGLTDTQELDSLRRRTWERGASALVVKGGPELAVAGSGSLIVIVAGASWTQIFAQAARQIEVSELGAAPFARLPANASDLNLIADGAAAALGGPVVIYDTLTRVVAYSGDQTQADDARMQALLRRRMPELILQRFRQAGVLQHINLSTEPLFVPALAADLQPRVVVGVRSGGQLLGSLWGLVSMPPGAAQVAAYARYARLAAAPLLRLVTDAEGSVRVESETLVQLIHGGPDAVSAAHQFRLAERAKAFWVVALALQAQDGEARAEQRWQLYQRVQQLRLLSDAIALAGEVNNAFYVILCSAADGREAVDEWVLRLIVPTAGLAPVAVAGVGRPAEQLDMLPRARQEAERALTVVRAGSGQGPIAFFADVWAEKLSNIPNARRSVSVVIGHSSAFECTRSPSAVVR